MAGPDIVLFVVGALLFGGAAAALVSEGGTGALTGGGSALGVFTVTYPLETAQVGEETVADFRSASATFDVQAENVAKVVVVVQCSDPVPAGSTFNLQVAVEGPNGLKGEPTAATCGGGAVEVPVTVAVAPPDTTVQGATEEAARENLPASENATLAVGAWKVTVNGNRAGAPVGIPAGNPSGTITLNVEQWAPKLTPVQR